ncbi:MAG: DUF3990 domain-containing protein [Coriobacteriales bacterium]|jgi:hypothetical protein|nr:DUF3990 domain-containing protein [Coriobacteriales bacterium]
MQHKELGQFLYHGSNVRVERIDLSFSAPDKDFGQGFYTTSDESQARKFAIIKAHRNNLDEGWVSIFSCNTDDGLRVKRFGRPDSEWLDFVLANRGFIEPGSREAQNASESAFDVVIGPVANDSVGTTLNLYVSGAYGKPGSDEAKRIAVELLLTQKSNNQVFFANPTAVDRLIFERSYAVNAR